MTNYRCCTISNVPMSRSGRAEDLLACADEAAHLIDGLRAGIQSINFDQNVRSYTALPLVLGAFDQISAFHHLAASPRGYMGAATLYRPIVEALFRGFFFAGPASDEEVMHYRTNDSMPKRFPMKPTPDRNKAVVLGVMELAEIVEQHLGSTWGTFLSNVIRSDWKMWHGIVHGGRAVVTMYGGAPDAQNNVGAEPLHLRWSADGMIGAIRNVVGFSLVTPAALAKLAVNESNVSAHSLMEQVARRHYEFLDRWTPRTSP